MTANHKEPQQSEKQSKNATVRHPESYLREQREPEELSNPLPVWYSIMSLCLLVWGAGYFYFQGNGPADAGDRRTALPPPGSEPLSGDLVYAANCASCHQGSGAGVPGAFPPLDGSKWVTGEADVPAQILLHGLKGPITVKGVAYNGMMPTMAHLSDGELAAALSYIRTEWSNSAPDEITEQWMTEQRQRFGQRGPWQVSELLSEVGGPEGSASSEGVAASEPAPVVALGPVTGDSVYSTNCASCHQASGAGIPGAFPPLDGSRWVNKDATITTQILLKGMQGPIEVKGETYSGVMPAMAHLTNEELAAVVTYIRNEWSNSGEPVTTEWIGEQRSKFADRGAWQGGAEIRELVGSPD